VAGEDVEGINGIAEKIGGIFEGESVDVDGSECLVEALFWISGFFEEEGFFAAFHLVYLLHLLLEYLHVNSSISREKLEND
jgi:hypothetical protein